MSLTHRLGNLLMRNTRAFSTTASRSNNVNRAFLVGYVGADAEVHTLPEGDRKYMTYTVGTSETHRDKDGNLVKTTQWHHIVNFNQAAIEWLPNKVKKGALVCVQGPIQYRSYVDRNGVQRTSTSILQDELSVLRLPKQKEAGEGEHQE
ncbi:uncharacterized protein VTP21DRAFT_4892 [Calcarisporiella thermophila]|uniref:uncharacterized protein n=1 Tax=Calcarisporiella thermophila TaxID=911321 RepID=UPI003743B00B